MKRKINARWKQRVAVSRTTRIRSSKVKSVVTQQAMLVGSEVLDSYTLRSCKNVRGKGKQRFWIDTLWSPAKNVRGKTQKFWVVFRQWATSQKLCITLKQWTNASSSVHCQHVKVINSECLKTADGNNQMSSVFDMWGELKFYVVLTACKHQKFCVC